MGRNIIIATLAASILLGCAKQVPKDSGTVRLAFANNAVSTLAIVALESGYFKDEGLRMQTTSHYFGKLALEAMLNGEADLAICAESPYINAVLAGKHIDIAAVIGTSNSNTALIAARKAGIAGVADLRGKRIGVTFGTTGEYFLDSLLVMHGIPASAVTSVNMLPEKMAAALSAGGIDAVVAWNPLLLQLRDSLGEGGLLITDPNAYTETFCLVGDGDFVVSHPLAMLAFIRALIRAEELVATNPDRAIAQVAKVSQTDEKIVREAFTVFRLKVSLDQALLLALDSEARWLIGKHPGAIPAMPDFIGHIYGEALREAKPERLRFIR